MITVDEEPEVRPAVEIEEARAASAADTGSCGQGSLQEAEVAMSGPVQVTIMEIEVAKPCFVLETVGEPEVEKTSVVEAHWLHGILVVDATVVQCALLSARWHPLDYWRTSEAAAGPDGVPWALALAGGCCSKIRRASSGP